MNNKGFAVSMILYSIMALFVFVMLLILTLNASNSRNQENISSEIKEQLSVNNYTDLKTAILSDNEIKENAILSTTSLLAGDNGLYMAVENENKIYYYRGDVKNNYVIFADKLWRIVRITENGNIRLMLNDNIGYHYIDEGPMYANFIYSNVYNVLLDWYNANLISYDNLIISDRFKESYVDDISTYTKPYFALGGSFVNLKIGLITLDEAMYAGLYPGILNNKTYFFPDYIFTMTMADYNNVQRMVSIDGDAITTDPVDETQVIKPVININPNVIVKGIGTIDNPYVVQ